MVHFSSWLVIAFVFLCQDAGAQIEMTSPSPATTSAPMQPIAIFGADTDKDNLKGKVPWRVIPGGMPFNTDKDKYKPYVIYPPPKQWYPPYYGKPYGYVNKDWDPPKRKDDVNQKKKKLKDLDDIPKYKSTDKKKTIDDMLRDRNTIIEFISMPGIARCYDGDKKFLDDNQECKRMKKNMAWAGKGPAMGSNCWHGRCGPQKLPPWQPYSFIGGSPPIDPYNRFPPTFEPDGNPLYFNPAANSLKPALNYPVADAAQNPYSQYYPQFSYWPYSYMYQNPFNSFPSPFPYKNYFNPYQHRFYPPMFDKPFFDKPSYGKPFFVEVDSETPKQELDSKKVKPVDESLKGKPEQKKKPTSTEEPKGVTNKVKVVSK